MCQRKQAVMRYPLTRPSVAQVIGDTQRERSCISQTHRNNVLMRPFIKGCWHAVFRIGEKGCAT
jgi:hypothetical protein